MIRINLCYPSASASNLNGESEESNESEVCDERDTIGLALSQFNAVSVRINDDCSASPF